MKTIQDFGFKSSASFLRTSKISNETFHQIVSSGSWSLQKVVLKHKKCPIDIRIEFTKNEDWYKRFVAYFSKNAPAEFWKRAANDTNVHLKRVMSDPASIALFQAWDIQKTEKAFKTKLKKLIED